MNILRNYFLVFTMVLMSLTFVACGNDTTENETTTTTAAPTTTKIETTERETKGGNSGKVDNNGVIGDIGKDIEEGVDDIGDGVEDIISGDDTTTTKNNTTTKK